MAQVYVAKQSAVTQYDGRTITIRRRVTRVEEGHELLERLPHLFEPVDASVQYRAENAQQAPSSAENARQEPTTTRTRAPRGGGRGKRATTKGEKPAETPAPPENVDPTPTGEQAEGAPAPEGTATPEGAQAAADDAPEGTPASTDDDEPEGKPATPDDEPEDD